MLTTLAVDARTNINVQTSRLCCVKFSKTELVFQYCFQIQIHDALIITPQEGGRELIVGVGEVR